MQVEIICDDVVNVSCDVLVVNIFEGVSCPAGATGAVDAALEQMISRRLAANPDLGKYGKVTELDTFGRIHASRVFVAGLGKREEFDTWKARSIAGTVMRKAREEKAKVVATIVHGAGIGGVQPETAAQATIEGSILGEYVFDRYKTTKAHRVTKLLVVENDRQKNTQFGRVLEQALISTNSVMLARDLGNIPANHLGPAEMAERASIVAQQLGLRYEDYDVERLREMGAGGILAVGAGSVRTPRLITLEYRGAPRSSHKLALVGKGVMFDSGGLCIKTKDSMHLMKNDMAGAAVVLAALQAIAQSQLQVNVLAVLPLVENMPSGTAYRVDDVLAMLSGATVEVVNTDAEGRLILADAVYFAHTNAASHILDIATLTGAVGVALGDVAAVMTNNNDFCALLKNAARDSNERLWELPMFDEYARDLDSAVADMKHTAGRSAGAITAAKFIERFVKGTPWTHIDIGGTAEVDTSGGYLSAGATGYGVRTLVRLAQLFGNWYENI